MIPLRRPRPVLTSAHRSGPVVLISRAIAFTFPLSYAYLAGYLRERGEEVVVLFKTGDPAAIVRQVMELRPVLVGIGSLYPELKETEQLVRLLGEADRTFPVVIGGQMVTPTPKLALEVTGADVGAVGEAEITLYRLVRALREGRDPLTVPGLVVRTPDGIVSTGAGEYIEDLTQLPPIPYDLFPTGDWLNIGLWYAHNLPVPHWHMEDRVINVHGGRGCPFKCNFCYHHSRARYRPVPLILSEAAAALERFDANFLYFSDDLVLVGSKRCRALIDGIKALPRKVDFSVSSRFDLLARMDDELLADMKAAGCRTMGLGIESGSDRILKTIGKRCTRDDIWNGLERLRRVDILPTVSIMVGQETETVADLEASIELVKDTMRANPKVNYAFTYTTPFPGSSLYEQIFARGLLRDEREFYDRYFDGSGGDFKQVVNLSAMTEQEIRDGYRRLQGAFEQAKASTKPEVFHFGPEHQELWRSYGLPFFIDTIQFEVNLSVVVRCVGDDVDWRRAMTCFGGELVRDLIDLVVTRFPEARTKFSALDRLRVVPFARSDLPQVVRDGKVASRWFALF